jgi:hypothetical protein
MADYISTPDFYCDIVKLPDVPNDERCWEMCVFQRCHTFEDIEDEVGMFEVNVLVYEGTYTAKEGAERAAKRWFKNLDAGKIRTNA